MNYRIFAVAGLLILLMSPGFAAAQRGGDDTQRPGEDSAGTPENPPPPPDPTPPPEDEKPGAPPAKVFSDNVQPDLAAWRHSKARSAMEAQKETYQGSPYFDAAWGYLLAQERRLDEAVTALDAASKAEPKDPVAPYLLAEVQSWKNNRDAAKRGWEQARDRARVIVEKDPSDPRAQFWLGASLVRLGQFDSARNHLGKALEKGFEPAMSEYQIGLSFTYQRNWNAARDAFNRCLAADSGLAHAYYYRGRVWKELGKTEEMLLDMDRFLKLAPDAREANAARSLLNAGG